MMVRASHGAPHPVDLVMLHVVCSAVPCCRVIAPTNCTYEWSVAWHCTVARQCSHMSARLIGHDNVVCPHVL
jgi:hypothetical protein